MMPSRGLQLAKGSLPRFVSVQSRKLSSAPACHVRHIPHLRPLISQTASATRSPLCAYLKVSPISAAGPRYASTASASAAPAAVAEKSSSTIGSLDTVILDNLEPIRPAMAAVPEKIGFLHELGIDYGWGPTSCIQWLLEHVHVLSGMPWWGSIIVTGATLRLFMLPLFIASSDSQARAMAMTPLTKPITDRMSAAQKIGDMQEMQLCWQELKTIRKEVGVSMPKQLIPMIIQGVVGYCGFKLLHAMAVLPVPGFLDGGFLWIENLTLSDGFLILPLLMALSIHSIVRFGGESGAAALSNQPPFMKNLMLYIMPGLMFLFLSWQPSGVALWFTGTGLVSIAQAQALQRPAVRQALGIAPLYRPDPSEGSGNSMMDMFNKMYGQKEADEKTKSKFASASWTYQAARSQQPNLRTTSSQPQTIDTTLVNRESGPRSTSGSSAHRKSSPQEDMIQPGRRGHYSTVTGIRNRFQQRREDRSISTLAHQSWHRSRHS